MADIVVSADGMLRWGEHSLPCVLGRSGITVDKREGDGATPVGRFSLRHVLYRADRLAPPQTALAVAAIDPADGWCDDPRDKAYNRPVRRPYAASHEALWRDDGVYDVVVVLGHNDDPPVPGRGSAIFLHVCRPDRSPTEGCVAVPLADLLLLLRDVAPGDALVVEAP